MKAIIIAALLYAAYKAIQRARERQEAERQRREEVQRQTDAARMREEWRRTQEQAKEAIHRQEELYREQERQRRGQEQIRREQERQAREQARLAKEQERQHREQIRQAEQLAALNFRISQAEVDIANGQERTAGLYALLDLALAAQHNATPGSPEEERAQRKILSLTNQINATERKIAKAQFDRETAQRKQAG